MSVFSRLFSMFRGAPATAPDGRTDEQAGATNPLDKTSIFYDLATMGTKNQRTMVQAFGALASGEPMNDKDLLLENGVSMLQSLPPDSGLGSKVAGGFIKMLWNDLPHPPGTVAGPTAKYRRHDGGNNVLWAPEMGKAGSPYSRSVPALKPKGPNLPDYELVFEHLLKRDEKEFRKHPSGLNRMFFSFATVVIHECFQTNKKDKWVNDTSSYVDLSTLYGNTENEQKDIRTKVNGQIFPDTIASERIMLMPPGVVAVLMLFSRHHNHIVENLLSINEGGKYGKWEELSKEQQDWQDNDLFQLGRNINVGFFASVVLRDYVAAILNTPRSNSEWSLDLGGEIKQGASRVERGAGNVVSVEFAVLYHWHASLSAADADWMEEFFRAHLPNLKNIEEMTPKMFYTAVGQEAMKLMKAPRKTWEFGGIKRGPDGRFRDADLGKIIKDCIEEPAHAFGAHGTPASLKVVDLMGQLQAREIFNVCTLNEFRRYLNLKEYDSFKEWNPDPKVANAAELLYGHIDNLELYPGLQAECTKQPMPGSGVCPGQTTGRGILDDAVALVRGDRFLTYDFNSSTLTNWGAVKLTDIQGGAYGGILSKLIFNGLPGEFNGVSAYAILPFYTPEAVKGILEGNKSIEKYDLKRPVASHNIVAIRSHEGCKNAVQDHENLRLSRRTGVRDTNTGHLSVLGLEEQRQHQEHLSVLEKAFFEDGFEKNISKFFREHTRDLIKRHSLKYVDARWSVDIVRDVCNVVPLLWLAERFAIPIKSTQSPRGLVSIPQLFEWFTAIYTYQNFNVVPANEWKLREASQEATPLLKKILETHLKTQQGYTERVVDWLAKDSAFEVKPDADRLFHAMNKTGLPISDLVDDLLSLGAPIAATLTQTASLIIDLYLHKKNETHAKRIAEIAQREDDSSVTELLGYVYEGMRLAGSQAGLPRVAAKDTTIYDGQNGEVRVRQGQPVLIATSVAALDSSVFPDPETINPSRPLASYEILTHGLHYAFGSRLVAPALASILKEVFQLKDLRRATQSEGYLSVLHQEVGGVKQKLFLDAMAKESAVPTSMRVIYGQEL